MTMSTNSDPSNGLSRDNRLNELIVEYLEAAERGAAPPVEEFVAKHAEFAESLRAFLNNQADFREMAKQVAPGSVVIAQGTVAAPPIPVSGSDPFAATINVRPSESAAASLKPVLRYFGDYELLHEIARGGMGVVYKARQVSLNRIVAVKMILSGQLASEEDVRRFYTEAEAAAQLDHPGIVSIFEVGRHQDQHFFSMAYVDGPSLARRVANGPLPPREAAELLKSVSEAVHYAHEKGVIHRDLKPGNILLGTDGRPRVTDFGLAKLTEQRDESLTGTGQILGTPAYMPPEQAAAKISAIGRHSDVYSLGAVLYCLLTGRPPFYAATPLETLLQVQQQEPVSLRALNGTVPRDLETIVLKCLDKSPSRRYATAQQLAEELQRYLEGRPILARPVSRTERAWRWCKRNPVVASLSTLAIGLLLAVSIVSFVAYRREVKLSADLTNESGKLAKSLDNEKSLTAAETKAKNEMRKARDDEREQRERVDAKEKQVRRNLYAAHMNLAQAAWEEGRVSRVLQLLKQYEPGTPADDLRGFEWFYWNKLCHRDLLTLDSPYASRVAFSPNGAQLASVANGGTVRVWDMATGEQTLTFEGHQGARDAIAFSPDGKKIVTSGGEQYDSDAKSFRLGGMVFWDAATGQELMSLTGHTAVINSVAFSPDGTRIASASDDHVVKVWDVASGQEIATFKGHSDSVKSVSFSPDGRRIASASFDGTVLVWDATTAKVILVLLVNQRSVRCVAFSSNGGRLAASHGDEVTIWDSTSGISIGALKHHSFGVNSFAWSPDDTRIAVASPDTVALWDTTTRQAIVTLKDRPSEVLSVAFSPDGKQIASASSNGRVKLWEARTEKLTATKQMLGQWELYAAISPDGTQVASHGFDSGEHVAKVWDTTTGQVISSLKGLKSWSSKFAFTADGTRIVSPGHDGTVTFWDVFTGRESENVRLQDGNSEDQNVWLSPDGERIALRREDGTIQFWSTSTGHQTQTLKGLPGKSTHIAISENGARIASAKENGLVQVWDANSGEAIATVHTRYSYLMNVALNSDGTKLATVDGIGTVKLWDAVNGKELLTFIEESRMTDGVAFSPDGMRIVASGVGQFKIWDTVSGQETLTLTGVTASSLLQPPAFSRDGTRIVIAGNFGGSLWDSGPRTADWKTRQRATLLLEGLLPTVSSRDALLTAIEEAHSFSKPVRQIAKTLVPTFWTARIVETHWTAQRLVDEQFGKGLFQDEVVASLSADTKLAPAVRVEALELARKKEGDSNALISASWNVVLLRDQPQAAYSRALRQAELANRLSPETVNPICTLGIAQYRAGQFEVAARTLTKSSELNTKQRGWPYPTDLAFLAMAQQQLGQKDNPRATLARARELMQISSFKGSALFMSFLREAETLIEPKFPPVTQEHFETKVPKSFQFDLDSKIADPERGLRSWTRSNDATFIEQYPSGKKNRLKILGRIKVGETDGTLVEKIGFERLQVFIADRESKNLEIKFRFIEKPNDWTLLGIMDKVE